MSEELGELVESMICEVVDVKNSNVQVMVRLDKSTYAEFSISRDKCPSITVLGGAFYLDIYNKGTKESPNYFVKTRQVDAEEEKRFLDEIFGIDN